MINNNEIHKKISQYIGLSFLNQDLLLLLKTNKQFQKIVNLLINILLKTQNYDDKESLEVSESFQKTFVQIVGEYNESLSINFEDENELLDNIRYFEIFVQNSLNKSINDIANQTSNVEEKVIPDSIIDANGEEYSHNNAKQDTQNKEFSAEDYIHNSGTNVNEIAEMMVRQQATMIVNKKILSGQVFIYNSKPKIIPILKIITAILFGILLILTISSSSILLYLNNKITIIKKPNDEVIGTYIFLPFPAMMIFTILINGLLVYSLIKNFKNDNVKYRINWLWPLAYTSILLITLLMESGTDRSIIFKPDVLKSFFENNSIGWKTYWPLIENYRYIQFACLAVIITILVVLIISIAYNPKRDFVRIEKLIIEYMNKIKKGEISNEDSTSSFGSKFSSELF